MAVHSVQQESESTTLITGSFEAPFKTRGSPKFFTFTARITEEPELPPDQARARAQRWADWAQSLIAKGQAKAAKP